MKTYELFSATIGQADTVQSLGVYPDHASAIASAEGRGVVLFNEPVPFHACDALFDAQDILFTCGTNEYRWIEEKTVD